MVLLLDELELPPVVVSMVGGIGPVVDDGTTPGVEGEKPEGGYFGAFGGFGAFGDFMAGGLAVNVTGGVTTGGMICAAARDAKSINVKMVRFIAAIQVSTKILSN